MSAPTTRLLSPMASAVDRKGDHAFQFIKVRIPHRKGTVVVIAQIIFDQGIIRQESQVRRICWRFLGYDLIVGPISKGGYLRKRNASLQRIQQAHHRKRTVVTESNEIDKATTVTTCEYFAEQITGVVISENYDCFRICGFNFCGHDVRPNGRRRVDGKCGNVRRLMAYLLPYV